MDTMKRRKVIEMLKEVKPRLVQDYGVKRMGLFGSYARDEEDENSDVDIVIESDAGDLFDLVHVKGLLEEALKRKVDIVRLRDNMNLYLKKRIEDEAKYV